MRAKTRQNLIIKDFIKSNKREAIQVSHTSELSTDSLIKGQKKGSVPTFLS
jgi:hypothetical protein